MLRRGDSFPQSNFIDIKVVMRITMITGAIIFGAVGVAIGFTYDFLHRHDVQAD